MPHREQSSEGATLEDRVTALETSHLNLRAELDANTKMTAAVKADTSILVDFANAMQGFARFCRGIGRVIKFIGMYIAPIGLLALTAWAVLTGKKAP
jgi:hypothetical protein